MAALVVALAGASPLVRPDPSALDLPRLDEVQAWAEAAAGPGPGRSAAARARWRAVLPDLTLRFGTDLDLDIRSATTRTVSEGQGLSFDAWARWGLADLVFNVDELRVDRELRATRAAQIAARLRATELYFERLEVRARRRVRDSDELRRAAARLDGLLDALTAGAYRRWRRGAS